MKNSYKKSILILLILLALTFSALGVTPALADDSTPPPATEEGSQPPADDPAVEEPAAEEPAEASEEEAVVVAEVLEQLPAETTLVVLDEGGETLPLVTEEAAAVLAAPDPYFTVGGTTYGYTSGASCASFVNVCNSGLSAPIQTAINALAGMNATPDDNTIYVEAGTYNEDVVIDGYSWNVGNLYLRGAGSGSTVINGSLDAYLPNAFGMSGFTFNDWVYVEADGDVNVSDVVVDGSNAEGGLWIYSAGNVTLEDVESYQSSYDGADVWADGDIYISNSTFVDNTYAGLAAYSSSGNVTLDGVTANQNGEIGAVVQTGGGEFFAVNSISTSEFGGDIFIADSTFNDNTWAGLITEAYNGNVTLNGVTASGNGDFGAAVFGGSGVQVLNSAFNDNGWAGLYAESWSGSVTLDRVTANGNGDAGAYLYSDVQVGIFCSDFSDNDYGVIGHAPDLYLNGATFSGNTTDYANEGGNVWVNDYPCGGGGGSDGGKKPIVLYIVIPQMQAQLPGALGAGYAFGSALRVVLTDQGVALDDLVITLSFPIPAGLKDANLAVMFWNGSTWVEIPGGNVVGDFFVITVGQPGYYVLVSK